MFDAWIAELGAIAVEKLDRRGICDLSSATARLRAALDAVDARAGAAIEALGDGGPGASTMFRAAGRVSQREADRRARRAAALAEMPSAAEALASGRLSGEHVDQLAKAASLVSPEAVDASDLVRKATARPADLLAGDVREWTRRQQSAEALAEQQQRRRGDRRCVVFDNDDQMTVLHAELDPATGAEVKAALAAATDALFRADGGRERGAEVRTPQQRRADALAALLTRRGGPVIGSGSGDDSAATTAEADAASLARKVPPAVRHQILVLAHVDGSAEIPGTGPISRRELARLSCNGDFFGLVFDTDGQPLWHGRRRRLADDNQWRVLIARDGGCRGCGLSPAHCEAHHIVWWQAPGNGGTDIDNLVLLCGHCHHLVHEEGWVVVATPGGYELRPP